MNTKIEIDIEYLDAIRNQLALAIEENKKLLEQLNEFKRAFLNIGLITPKKDKTNYEHEL